MKKLIYLGVMMVLCICMTSCGEFNQAGNVKISITFDEDLIENGYEFGLLEDIRISSTKSFDREILPESNQIIEGKVIYSFRVDKIMLDSDVIYVKGPSVHKIEGISPLEIPLEEAVIKNSDGEDWFEITKAKEDVGSTDVAFTSLNGDVPLNFQLHADGKRVSPYTLNIEKNELGSIVGNMSFKKWPIDDEGARLFIKSSLAIVELKADDFVCEGKQIVVIE